MPFILYLADGDLTVVETCRRNVSGKLLLLLLLLLFKLICTFHVPIKYGKRHVITEYIINSAASRTYAAH